MSFSLVMQFYHVFLASLLIGGLFAQIITLVYALRTRHRRTALVLLRLSDLCEAFVVLPCGLFTFLFGALTAWGQGRLAAGLLATPGWLTVSIALFVVPAPLFLAAALRRRRRYGALLRRAMAGDDAGDAPLPIGPAALLSRVAELGLVVAILFLMIAKPA